MSDRIYVKYDDIVKNESKVIEYLSTRADFFSVIAVIKKPYLQMPPVFNYDSQLRPFVKDYLFDRSDWPVDFFGRSKHQIMVVCRCCKESREELLRMPNLFLPIDNDMPEDICFYRNGVLLFGTVSHEKIAFFSNVESSEVFSFKENCMKSCN